MFTGIIEATGTVVANQSDDGANHLVIASDFTHLQLGESIAVNGVCLTLLPSEPGQLRFDVSPETLRCTTLAHLTPNTAVNLERAMLASTRFGGHYVSGHVDAIAQVQGIKQINEFLELDIGGFAATAKLYLIPKGSITVEGVSLTINAVSEQGIKLMLVPHSLANTTLGFLQLKQEINIEFDYLTRIVAHQLEIAGNLRVGE